MKFVIGLLAVPVILSLGEIGVTEDQFELVDKDVVVFFGGTNMLHLQQAGELETRLTSHFAEVRPRFRDFSWEADTVFQQGTVIERWRTDGFGSRDDQLKRVGATVVFAQFGRLESMSGPAPLREFVATYDRLIARLTKQVRIVVLLSPTPFEKSTNSLVPDLTRHNADLALYVRATAELADKHGLIFVDLFNNEGERLTDNGMHITPASQAGLARRIANALGVLTEGRIANPALREAVIEKHRLWYDYWRPANWKLLYGDDSRRVFTRGGNDHVPFRDEWKRLLPLIAGAEDRVLRIAAGGDDSGHSRPLPEVLHGDARANIEDELSAFTASDGLRVNLFASEREGLTSPLAVRWDPAGRMFVSVTTTYPHVVPGDVPNDKIIVLEDTDRDGQADKSTVFAEGLNIPTGFELGDGGVYVGQNTELLFLRDTNGDGRADSRRVLLSGFGNGDSHQTINSFIWSPGGELYFGQGDGIESRVETPWGPSHLFQAGFYRLRPRRLQLDPLLDDFMGPGNPWGVAFDAWGQIFSIDGAGGVTFLSPGQIPTSHRKRLRTIGKPGGYCGIGFLDGRHLPPTMHGDFAVGDFKGNRIKRFSVTRRGAGFSLDWKDPLLQSRHRNFRPVDVKVGPDGAIYVVDWYNPVTCHQDDAYRDPTRDKAHGRIWRLAAATRAAATPDLAVAPLSDVLDALKSPEHWTRYQAKRALTSRKIDDVSPALHAWVRSLDPQAPLYEHHLYEALGVYATLELVAPALLDRLLWAREPLARAYAARIVGRWHDRLTEPLNLLSPRILDEDPLVRMEAVMACAAIDSIRSIAVAARVGDRPRDEWIDYSFIQATHHLRPVWLAALRDGNVPFSDPRHLATVLNEAAGREVIDDLKRLADADDLPPTSRAAVIAAILSVGDADDLRIYGLDTSRFRHADRYDAAAHANILARLIETTRFRKLRPSGNLADALNDLLDQRNLELRSRALTLAGLWKVDGTQDRVRSAAQNQALPVALRAAALGALANMQLPASRSLLVQYAGDDADMALRSSAIQSLASIDMPVAAGYAATVFSETELNASDCTAILRVLLAQKGGAAALTGVLRERPLTPARATHVLRALFATGHSNKLLFDILNRSLGADTNTADYSAQYVERLVLGAQQMGQAKRGADVFQATACSSCHKISGSGGSSGPDLTAIGTTLSPQRIAEEVLWPNRHVKEGFSLVQVITDQGKVHVGYERTTRDSRQAGDLILEDLATRQRITISQRSIEQRRVTGSPMPTGLTSRLSRAQLLDLVRYLSELGRIR
ncbi:MAG: PVC-type heme-binding CxxCH protein [Planctomycetaceae bacterium]